MFGNSSSNIYLSGTTLYATCKDSQGNDHQSSMNLNNYIGNIEGALTWGQSNFAASSSNISLSGTVLSATCQDSNGGSHHSSINLNQYIMNNEGQLQA